MKKNPRKIGLDNCKKVANFLKSRGHVIGGPFSKVVFQKGRKMASHVDIFGTYDLVSFDKISKEVYFHQVTALNMKARKVKKIMKEGPKGIVWCPCILDEGKEGCRRFVVDPLKKEVWETSSIIF